MSTPLPVSGPGVPSGGGYGIPEFDQDPGDVLQEQEDRLTVIPVEVTEPVRSIALPGKRTTFYTVSDVTATTGVQLLGRDPRRKHATIIGLAQDVILGSTQSNALNGARIPAVVPFVISSMDEVWAVAVTSTTDISVIVEFWSE